MNQLTFTDATALMQLILFTAIVISLLLLILVPVVYKILDKFIFQKIRFPKRINTEHGQLFRTITGIYVREDILQDFNLQQAFKDKERHIRILEFKIDRLKRDLQAQTKH